MALHERESGQGCIRKAAVHTRDRLLRHHDPTPLNAILGFSDLLESGIIGLLSEKQLAYVKNIHSGGDRLMELIDNILDIIKVETGEMEREANKFLLKEVLLGSIVDFREKAIQQGINLAIEMDPPDMEVVTDPEKLKRIVDILLNNAWIAYATTRTP